MSSLDNKNTFFNSNLNQNQLIAAELKRFYDNGGYTNLANASHLPQPGKEITPGAQR